MARQQIAQEELIELIRQRMSGDDSQADACSDCVPQQLSPIRPVAGGINWQVLAHPHCSAPCQARMLEVCKTLADHYDVRWPEGSTLPG